MTITEFQEKLNALRKKSGMDPDVQWPIVSDPDEKGEILLCEEGAFAFADKRSNWITSHLTVAGVENLRYKVQYGVSHIYINFSNGDSWEFRNMKMRNNRRVVLTDVNIVRTEANAELAELIKQQCDTSSTVGGNAVYVKLQ